MCYGITDSEFTQLEAEYLCRTLLKGELTTVTSATVERFILHQYSMRSHHSDHSEEHGLWIAGMCKYRSDWDSGNHPHFRDTCLSLRFVGHFCPIFTNLCPYCTNFTIHLCYHWAKIAHIRIIICPHFNLIHLPSSRDGRPVLNYHVKANASASPCVDRSQFWLSLVSSHVWSHTIWFHRIFPTRYAQVLSIIVDND